MDKNIMATRRALAQQRFVTAVQRLGETDEKYRPALDALNAVNAKDPNTKTVLQMEAALAVLEGMAGIDAPTEAVITEFRASEGKSVPRNAPAAPQPTEASAPAAPATTPQMNERTTTARPTSKGATKTATKAATAKSTKTTRK